MAARLRKGDITIKEVLTLSRSLYKKEHIDNKLIRERKDIVGGKITFRRGLEYDRKNKKWIQSSRDVRLDFVVRSKPISYKKTDTVPVHKYPVTFLIKDWEKGFNSSFRWRTGGLKKWIPTEKHKRNISEGKNEKEKQKIREEKEKTRKKNLDITNTNIRNGLQGNFIFHLMWVLKQYDLLFGPLTCKNQAPSVTNPKHEVFFDKTALYIVLRVLPKVFKNPKINQVFGKK